MSPILQGLANGSVRGYGGYLPLGASTAFESIASATGTGSNTSITFSSIPSTYQHLQLRIIARKTLTDSFFYLQPNGATGSVYTYHELLGYGTGVAAAGFATGTYNNGPYLQLTKSNDTASTFGVAIVDIHDYASTTKTKTMRWISGADVNGDGNIFLASSMYNSTSAISSFTITCGSTGAFATGTTIALYGIKGA